MKVLVTGSEGYIGAVMVPVLQEAGHEVVGLDTVWYPASLGPAPSDHEVIRADVRDVTTEHLDGFDAIVHLAALSNDPLGDLGGDITDEINHRASVSLARTARDAGVERFVFASSCSLYGAGGDDLLDEDAATAPVTAYGHSKIDTEHGLTELAGDDFSPTSMRNATAFGYSPHLRVDIVVNNLVGHAIATGQVLMTSDGTPWRPLVHIADISGAALAILEAPREVVHDRAFNIGSTSVNHQIREIAELVAESVDGTEVAFGTDASPDVRDYKVDFSRLAQDLPDFSIQWSLVDGIEEMVEAYQRHGFDQESLTGPSFIRLRRIRQLLDAGQLDDRLRWQD